MKRFPPLLDRFLTANKEAFTAMTFAEKSDVHSGDLSRVRSGTKTPTREFTHKILESPLVPLQDALQLTVAYLRDITPVNLEPHLSITVKDDALDKAETPDLLTECLEFFRQAARTDAETYAWLTSLYKTLSSKW